MRVSTFKTGNTPKQARTNLFAYLNSLHLTEPVTTVMPTVKPPMVGKKSEIIMIDSGASEAVVKVRRANPTAAIAVLNFASYKNPGGGFMDNKLAQEEDLCYCSNLYKELEKHRFDFYSQNQCDLNSGLYRDRCLLTEHVSFVAERPDEILKNNEVCEVDVITCAAPNLSYLIRSGEQKSRRALKAMLDRIHYINSVLAGRDYDIVIYGAFGCGVFRNDPTFTATCFKWDLETNYPNSFRQIIFAIPNEYSRNYQAFRNVLFGEGEL